MRLAAGRRLQHDLAVDRIAAEEAQAHAAVARAGDVVHHRAGPVLVVADGEKSLHAQQAVGVAMGVDVRDVRHVVAVLLEPEGQRKLPEQELAGAVAERRQRRRQHVVVERVRPVEADLRARRRAPALLLPVVERPPRGPAVVGLPGEVGHLEHQVGLAIVADDPDDVALVAGLLVGQLAEIDAAQPVGRNRDLERRAPACLHQLLVAFDGLWLRSRPAASRSVVIRRPPLPPYQPMR